MADRRKDMDVMLDPQKYGYDQCPHCNGYGSSLKETADRCTVCDGTGLVTVGINCEDCAFLDDASGDGVVTMCANDKSEFYEQEMGPKGTCDEAEKK